MANFLEKIRNLPEKKRKIIFWSAVSIIGLMLIIFWLKIAQKRIGNFQLPFFEMPEINIEINNEK